MKKSGFSLIELAIVITIIGLLVAGVTAGSRLMKQAELKTVLDDLREYEVAFNSFHLAYEELPGDMLNSSALAVLGITNHTRVSTNPEGDGFIGGAREGPMAFWHMKIAGFINGNYTGIYSANEVPGVNVGFSNYDDQAGYNFFTFGITNNQWGYGTASVYLRTKEIALVFGTVRLSGNGNQVSYAVLTPEQAHSIDEKIDDALPHLGKIMADHAQDVGNDNQCLDRTGWATNYTSGDQKYKRDNTALACRMMYVVR